MKCFKCNDALIKEDALECALCRRTFHFGCGALTETNFRKMNKQRKEQIKCPECKDKKDVTFTVPTNSTPESDSALMKNFNELAKDLKSTMAGLEASVQHNSDVMDDILASFKDMKSNFEQMQAKQEELTKENAILKKTVKDLQQQVFQVDQKSLDHNVEIVGIPDAIEEDRVVPSLCGVMNISAPEAKEYTVRRARVGAAGKAKSVFVQFESKRVRDEFLKSGKKTKPKVSQLTKNSSDTGAIYVNEELTPHYKLLFYNANKIRKEKEFKYLWVGDGKILLKKTDTARIIQVRNLEDLN